MAYDNTLPDIPYTPMKDSNINDGASTSSAVDSPPVKRSRALTPAERMARSRKAQSAEKREETKSRDIAAKEKARADQSVEKKVASKSRNRAAMEGARANQSVEKREESKSRNRADMEEARANQSVEKRETYNARNTAAIGKA